MPNLTPTQREVLLAAAQHSERQVILPGRLRGGAVQVVIDALLARGLIERGNSPFQTGFTITDAGLQAIGSGAAASEKPAPASAPSKQSIVVELLRRPQGASLEEITAATGWQKHTVRGLISGALKKKLGLTVTSQMIEGVRRYRIGGDQ